MTIQSGDVITDRGQAYQVIDAINLASGELKLFVKAVGLVPPPTPGPTPQPGKGPIIGFGLFGPATGAISALVPTMNAHGLKLSDYGDNFTVPNLDKYPNQLGKDLLFYSVNLDMNAQIQAAKSAGFGFLGYDIERSNGNLSTPPDELAALASYISKAADAVHGAGFKFGIAPGAQIYESNPEWSKLDWSKIDFWLMQGNSVTGTVQAVIQSVTQFAAPIKAAHPNVMITRSVNEGTSGGNMTPQEVAEVWSGIKGHCDGVELHRYTSPADVDAILKALGR